MRRFLLVSMLALIGCSPMAVPRLGENRNVNEHNFLKVCRAGREDDAAEILGEPDSRGEGELVHFARLNDPEVFYTIADHSEKASPDYYQFFKGVQNEQIKLLYAGQTKGLLAAEYFVDNAPVYYFGRKSLDTRGIEVGSRSIAASPSASFLSRKKTLLEFFQNVAVQPGPTQQAAVSGKSESHESQPQPQAVLPQSDKNTEVISSQSVSAQGLATEPSVQAPSQPSPPSIATPVQMSPTPVAPIQPQVSHSSEDARVMPAALGTNVFGFRNWGIRVPMQRTEIHQTTATTLIVNKSGAAGGSFKVPKPVVVHYSEMATVSAKFVHFDEGRPVLCFASTVGHYVGGKNYTFVSSVLSDEDKKFLDAIREVGRRKNKKEQFELNILSPLGTKGVLVGDLHVEKIIDEDTAVVHQRYGTLDWTFTLNAPTGSFQKREWLDAAGKREGEAELVDFRDGIVTLKKAPVDAKFGVQLPAVMVQVPIDKLSDHDQETVSDHFFRGLYKKTRKDVVDKIKGGK